MSSAATRGPPRSSSRRGPTTRHFSTSSRFQRQFAIRFRGTSACFREPPGVAATAAVFRVLFEDQRSLPDASDPLSGTCACFRKHREGDFQLFPDDSVLCMLSRTSLRGALRRFGFLWNGGSCRRPPAASRQQRRAPSRAVGVE